MTRIGITTSVSSENGVLRQSLDHAYVRAVERAGGVPILLPATDRGDTMAAAVGLVDGLLIPGGPGIVQGLVGSLPDDLPPVSETRWAADCLAFDCAREQGLPVLGICYGMQFVNARLGGTLLADVQAQLGVGPHSPGRNDGAVPFHAVHIEPGTRLAAIAGRLAAEANSRHLQAIQRPAPELVVSARSADGVVEGVETRDGRIVGVQFHPEGMPGSVWDGLFDHLVAAASAQK